MIVPVVNQTWACTYRIVEQGLAAEHGCRVLLVGEDNPQDDRPSHALWPQPGRDRKSCAGKNLQSKILRVPHAYYYGMWRTNLCISPWATSWDLDVARRRAEVLSRNTTHPWRTIVMLGRKVAGCFEYATGIAVKPFDWAPYWFEAADGSEGHMSLVSLPHPSGLSREWNDPRSYDRALEVLRIVEPDEPWGSLGNIPLLGQG